MEIYNHQKLEMVYSLHLFRTKTDSEVIVHLYEEFGYDFVIYAGWNFAFVIINGDDFMAARIH
jgi:asparagine synthase (glutamine-hydrolysing)